MSAIPAWLKEAPLQQWFAAVRAAGGEARAVGGCVRDHLMGVPVGDVDLATTLLPERVIKLAAEQGYKAIPTGIAHGTVTVVLPSRAVEITTLRRDVTTDGRHATVAYTDDWEEDAARRDFTINALSMDATGALYDYFHGRADIALQRVAFIGDARQRIAEDGLRMLRFFRFLATHGKPPADKPALEAIAENIGKMEKLSGERIGAEMRKLLMAGNPAYALRRMQESGLAAQIFGRAIDPSRIIRLTMLEARAEYQCSVMARALLLLPDATSADVDRLAQRWKLSRREKQDLMLLSHGFEGIIADTTKPPPWKREGGVSALPRYAHTHILRKHGAPVYLDFLLMEAVRGEGVEIAPYVRLAHEFVPPIFPITAADLLARGMKEGKLLGDTLAALEHRWEISDYQLTREELLSSASAPEQH